jgi:hypothetical protein
MIGTAGFMDKEVQRSKFKGLRASPTAGLQSGQSDRKGIFNVIRSATKTPRHQDYIEIFGAIPQMNSDNLKYISSLRVLVPWWQNCY